MADQDRISAVSTTYLKLLVAAASSDMLRLNVLSAVARIMSFNRVRVYSVDPEINPTDWQFPNMYALLFAQSCIGKDHTADEIDMLMSLVYEEYDKLDEIWLIAEQSRIEDEVQNKKRMVAGEEKNLTIAQQERFLQDNEPEKTTRVFSDATPEGIYRERAIFQRNGYGASYFKHTEYADYLTNIQNENVRKTNEYFKTIFAKGIDPSKIGVSFRRKQVEDIPHNMFVASSKAKLFDDEVAGKAFKTFLERGQARRMVMCVVPKGPLPILSIEEKEDRQLKASMSRGVIQKWFHDLHLNTLPDQDELHERTPKVMVLSDEARRLYYEYENKNRQKFNGMLGKFRSIEDSETSELLNRHRKAVQFSALHQAMEHGTDISIISAESFAKAVKDVDTFGEHLNSVLYAEQISPEQRTYYFLLDNIGKQKISTGALRTVDWAPSNNSQKSIFIQTQKDLVPDIAHQDGYELIIEPAPGRGKSEYYYLQRMPTIDDIAVEGKLPDAVFSYSDQTGLGGNQHPSLGFKKKVIPFDRLHEMLTVYPYATHPFKEGHRSNDDAVCEGNIMIVDIDNKDGAETLSMDEAKERFKDYACLIMPSKNHQKDKALEGGGVSSARDRFRIIFLYSEPIDIPDHKQYMETVLNCWKMMGLYDPSSSKEPMVDVALAKKSQYSRCSPLVPLPWYSEGEKIINWKPFLASKLPKKTYVKQERYDTDDDDVKAIPIRQLVEACGKTLTKERGDNQWYDCPFHNSDKKVAFLVTTSKNIWHCFNCLGPEGKSSGGSSVDFVMQKFGWSNDTVGKAKAYSVLKNYLQTGNLEEV